MAKRLTEAEYYQLIQSSYPAVVGGYSGLGYADYELVRRKLRGILSDLLAGQRDNILLVSGATAQGIGVVYEVAKEFRLPTLGIVSECAQPEDISCFCEQVFYVPDPDGTWEVKSSEGDSYVVEAGRRGQMFYLGGGEVAVNEIVEAKSKGVTVNVFSDFFPDPKEVEKRLRNSPDFVSRPTCFL